MRRPPRGARFDELLMIVMVLLLAGAVVLTMRGVLIWFD